jgi:hypothetical protein
MVSITEKQKLKQEAKEVLEIWMEGVQEDALSRLLRDYDRVTAYAIITHMILLMLHQSYYDKHPLPKWVEFIEGHL